MYRFFLMFIKDSTEQTSGKFCLIYTMPCSIQLGKFCDKLTRKCDVTRGLFNNTHY